MASWQLGAMGRPVGAAELGPVPCPQPGAGQLGGRWAAGDRPSPREWELAGNQHGQVQAGTSPPGPRQAGLRAAGDWPYCSIAGRVGGDPDRQIQLGADTFASAHETRVLAVH